MSTPAGTQQGKESSGPPDPDWISTSKTGAGKYLNLSL